MSTTTLPAPRRITTLEYVKAAVAVRLGLEPEHEGADAADWAQQLRDMRLADAATRRRLDRTAAVRPVRRPVAALAAVPYREVVDEHLGLLRIAGQEPARLFDGRRYAALTGGAA